MNTILLDEESVIRRPHDVNPVLSSLRVILAIKNFAAIPGVCHIGLGVTAANTVKVLRRNGVHAEAWSAQTAKELAQLLIKDHQRPGRRPITHVIVSAPSWVQPNDFQNFCFTYPDIHFVQLNHSGTAYLSIDKFGIRNIRECIDLSLSLHNLSVAGNNPRFVQWLENSLGYKAPELTNLYDTESFVQTPGRRRDHDPLRIGSFGAGRPWKNQLTAAEAAVSLAKRLGVNLEYFVNTMRPDGGERMIESRRELFHNLPGTKVIEVPWALWPKFRRVVATMDLLFSPSFDETFNVVTADGIAEGVPSVTTPALEWTPKHWWAEPWDPASVMHVGLTLLHNPTINDARANLTRYVRHGLHNWLRFLLHGDGLKP